MPDPELHHYGDGPSQYAELWRPAPGGGRAGVVVVLHGGFWRARYDASLMHAICRDLAERGWAAWNVEYRRLGDGGGWPETFDDVAAAVQALRDVDGLDLDHVVAVGHSAGGHLALWAAAQEGTPIRSVASQAGVADLREAARLGLSDGAARQLVGGAEELYGKASPAELLPLGVPQLLVHGARDDVVPLALVEGYAERARAAGDDVELLTFPDAGHFEHIDPDSEVWRATADWLTRR